MEFLRFAQPVPEPPAENVLCPGSADAVLPSLDRYELQLAYLALEGAEAGEGGD
ncbi:hypothetical protein SDC9_190511 [bioreactor metagenome]|uniref:Uncharacterized protein n=1 Tax=bioreactor metagenome TaxID=1076179 RepID=A0A645I665_9ZZZZ